MADVLLLTDVTSPGYGKYAGTYKISTEIRKHGYSCQVIDNYSYLGKDKIKTLFDKFIDQGTVMIGFSSTLASTDQSEYFGLPLSDILEIFNYAKQLNNNIKICLGGSKIDSTLDLPFIDYTVVGKADNAIIALIEHLKKETELKYTSNNYTRMIKGDDYFYTPDQFSNSQIIYDDNDIIFPNEVLPAEVARGCIFQCAFCRYDLIGKKIGDWTKNKNILIEEFTRNYEKFGVTSYMFTDELVNESVGKMEMLAEVANSLPFQLRYTAYARIDLIGRYPEMINLLSESGAQSLSFGIETLNYETGKIIGKGLSPERVKETLSQCKQAWQNNVMISGNFIVGLPKETEESIWKTVEYLLEEDCPIDIFNFASLGILANTEYRNQSKIDSDPEKYGYSMKKRTIWESENLTSSKSQLLVKRIYNDPRIKERISIGSATFLGRILNLGYSVEEIFNIMKNKELLITYKNEIITKTSNLKEKYYQDLLNI